MQFIAIARQPQPRLLDKLVRVPSAANSREFKSRSSFPNILSAQFNPAEIKQPTLWQETFQKAQRCCSIALWVSKRYGFFRTGLVFGGLVEQLLLDSIPFELREEDARDIHIVVRLEKQNFARAQRFFELILFRLWFFWSVHRWVWGKQFYLWGSLSYFINIGVSGGGKKHVMVDYTFFPLFEDLILSMCFLFFKNLPISEYNVSARDDQNKDCDHVVNQEIDDFSLLQVV